MTPQLEVPPADAAVTLIAPEEIEPCERSWTREEYYRLFELGFFDGQKVQLIDAFVRRASPCGF